MNYDSEIIESNGLTVRVSYEYDECSDAPWDNECGRGNVRKSSCNGNYYTYSYGDKKPGERPLNQAGRNEYQFYYDWQDAVKRAKIEGWNCEPFDAPNRVIRAVQSDFDFLRGYINQEWVYVGVTVTVLDDDGEPVGEPDSVWGIETHKGYHHECAKELADECTKRYVKDLRDSELAERIESRYHDAQNLGVIA